MKKLVLFLLILAIASGISIAGEPKTKTNDRAFLFSISGLGTFNIGGLPVANIYQNSTKINLVGIGMKYYIADNMALRGGLNFHYDKTDKASTADSIIISNTYFGFAPGIEYHFVNTGSVTAYVGGEVMFGMTNYKSAPVHQTETGESGTLIGVGGLFGVEFFPWDNISLGAEYKLSFSTNTTTISSGGKDYDGPTYTNINTDSWAVTLGVYF